MLAALAQAELSLAPPFQPGMVLQRGAPIVVHGSAAPGADVRVQFDGEVVTAEAGPDGAWRVSLAPRSATVLARTLVVEGDGGRLALDDVLVGDVWLLAGSADVAAPLGPRGAGLLAAAPAHVRLFVPTPAARPSDAVWSAEERAAVAGGFYRGRWSRAAVADPAVISAVAVHFALTLEASQQVPVGVIQLATVPATLESWIPRPLLMSEPRLALRLVDWWRSEAVPSNLRERARRNLAGHFDREATAPDAGVHPFQPGFLWGAAVAPFRGSAYAGAVLGCESASLEDPALHEHLLRAFVAAWREELLGDRPVLLVESHGGDLVADPTGAEVALRRDIERSLAHGPSALPRVGFVVAQDLPTSGTGVERRRRVIGERLALWALDLVHDRVGVVSSGPMPVSHVTDTKARATRVVFEHAVGLATRDGDFVRGFDVVGADGEAVRATARLSAGAVIVEHPSVVTPREIRYGFDPASLGNLVNGAGLPAPTFRLVAETSRAIEAAAQRRAGS